MKGLILVPTFKVTDRALEEMRSAGVPDEVLSKLRPLKNKTYKGMHSFLGALPINHYESTTYSLAIVEAAKVKGRKHRAAHKKPWLQRLRKPSLKLYSWKIVQSTVLSVVLLLAIYGLDVLVKWLFGEPADPMVGLIKWVKNWLSFALFVVFLTVKVLHNLGIIED